MIFQYITAAYALLLLLTGCSPKKQEFAAPALTSISIVDRNGFSETISVPKRSEQYENVDFLSPQPYERVMRIFCRDTSGNITAILTSYHPNGQPKQYLEIVNSRACGTYQEWHLNGILKLEVCVINGEPDFTPQAQKTWLFDGMSEVWDECGNLIAEIPYCTGMLEGEATYYHMNGSVWKLEHYSQGQYHGTCDVFLESGALLQSTEYKEGVKHGTSKRYWDAERLACEEVYCQGKLMNARYYNGCGECLSTIDDGCGFRVLFSKDGVSEMREYRNGIPEGEVKVFGTDGSLLNLYHTKNDLKHGEEIEYFNPLEVQGALRPRLSIQWTDGRIQGLVKTWFPDGVQESQREMVSNVKNGLLTAWYRNGSVMLIERYDHNKLMDGRYFAPGEKIPISEIHDGRGTATFYDPQGNFLRKVEYNKNKPVVDK